MPPPFMSRSIGILSIHYVNDTLLEIRGFSSCGFLEIRLASHSSRRTPLHVATCGVVCSGAYDDFRLAEDIKNEVLALLEYEELSWLRRPFTENYSMFIRHNGQPALYWLGQDVKG